jgi:hypothetical protein
MFVPRDIGKRDLHGGAGFVQSWRDAGYVSRRRVDLNHEVRKVNGQ